MAEFNICRRQLNDEGEAVKYCTGRINKANALDWCDKCRERLPFWPAGESVAKPKHHAAFDRKTGEGQEHLGPRGITSYVKTEDFQETL